MSKQRQSRARTPVVEGGIRLSRQEVLMRERGYIGQAHAARRMGVTDEQIHKLFAAGKLAGTRMGGRVYITMDSLKQYYGPMAEELLAPSAVPGPDLGPVGPAPQGPCPPGMEPARQCVPAQRRASTPASMSPLGPIDVESNIPAEFQTPNPTRNKKGGR